MPVSTGTLFLAMILCCFVELNGFVANGEGQRADLTRSLPLWSRAGQTSDRGRSSWNLTSILASKVSRSPHLLEVSDLKAELESRLQSLQSYRSRILPIARTTTAQKVMESLVDTLVARPEPPGDDLVTACSMILMLSLGAVAAAITRRWQLLTAAAVATPVGVVLMRQPNRLGRVLRSAGVFLATRCLALHYQWRAAAALYSTTKVALKVSRIIDDLDERWSLSQRYQAIHDLFQSRNTTSSTSHALETSSLQSAPVKSFGQSVWNSVRWLGSTLDHSLSVLVGSFRPIPLAPERSTIAAPYSWKDKVSALLFLVLFIESVRAIALWLWLGITGWTLPTVGLWALSGE